MYNKRRGNSRGCGQPCHNKGVKAHIIEAGETGSLLVPAEAAGLVPPGTRFTVEPHGNIVILRREVSTGRSSDISTPADRFARLRAWITVLPQSPPLRPEATHRDSMYD